MIRSFRCADTRSLASGWSVPRFQAFERVARRKLRQLEIASRLDDLLRLNRSLLVYLGLAR